MIINEMKYCYNDITIVPSIKSCIEHRSECNPYMGEFEKSPLPIFASPMSTVINEKNFSLFEENNIIPILPRNVVLETRCEYLKNGKWVALGLQEFEDLFINNNWDFDSYPRINVLIDIANGHMSKMHNMVYEAKNKYKFCQEFKIMVGNIANPQTYYELAKAGADFIRLGIGGGSGCITASNTSIYYGYASLIYETYQIKKRLKEIGEHAPCIIADGGIRNYSDVIKAIGALGADYVMIGGLFSQVIESAAKTFYVNKEDCICEVNPFNDKIEIKLDGTFEINGEIVTNNLYKVFYGMASRKGQEDMNGVKSKTSEGIEKTFKCTTNLRKWKENMVSYIQSAMSYTNCRTIQEFNPENVNGIIISTETQKSINK